MEIKHSDLVELFKILENQHPNLYCRVSKKAFWHKINSLKKDWASFDIYKQNYWLKHLFSMIGDLHTTCFLTFALDKDFPFEVKRLDGKYYISNLDERFLDKKYLFSEIVGINNHAISKVETLLFDILPSELLIGKYRGVCTHLTYLSILKIIGMATEEYITLDLKQDGKVEKVRVEAVVCDKNQYIFTPTKPYWFENRNDYYYFRIKDFSLSSQDLPKGYDENFNKFVLNTIQTCGVKPVVVDLRDNPGGYADMFNKIFDVMDEQNFEYFGIVNNNSLSASIVLAARLKNKGGFLVGQNAGQPYKFYAYAGGVSQAKSGIRFKCSKKLVVCKVIKKRQSIKQPFAVDKEVFETVEDLKNGLDKPLEFCVMQIKNKSLTT